VLSLDAALGTHITHDPCRGTKTQASHPETNCGPLWARTNRLRRRCRGVTQQLSDEYSAEPSRVFHSAACSSCRQCPGMPTKCCLRAMLHAHLQCASL
jgi:hypothetical protein